MTRTKTPKELLGSIVKDEVSGIQGIATAIALLASGNIQIAISPPVVKGFDKLKSFFIDVSRVKFIKKGPVPAIVAPDTSHIKLGWTVKDILSGYEGVVTEKTIHMNGCSYIVLQATGLNKDGKPHEKQVIDWQHVSIVGSKQVLETPEVEVAEDTPPKGGFSREVEY